KKYTSKIRSEESIKGQIKDNNTLVPPSRTLFDQEMPMKKQTLKPNLEVTEPIPSSIAPSYLDISDIIDRAMARFDKREESRVQFEEAKIKSDHITIDELCQSFTKLAISTSISTVPSISKP